MLEDWAIAFAGLPSLGRMLTGYAAFAVGCLLGIFADRRPRRIHRAPYFALASLAGLAATVAQAVWWLFVPAVIAGTVWLVVLVSLGSFALAGYAVGWVAAARATDASGRRAMALLTFIPFVNLWLLFARTRKPAPEHRLLAFPALAGGVGVVIGLVALVAAWALSAYISARTLEIAGSGDAWARRAGIILRVKTEGLENVLKGFASAVKLPIVVDDRTTLVRVEANGNEIRRIYVVRPEDLTVGEEVKTALAAEICGAPVLSDFIHSGATIRQVYATASGRTVAEFSVDRASCGF